LRKALNLRIVNALTQHQKGKFTNNRKGEGRYNLGVAMKELEGSFGRDLPLGRAKLSEGRVAIGGLFLLALWLLVGLPWLNGPLERVEYRYPSQATAQATKSQPTGSAQSPYFIQVMPGAKSAQQRQEEAEDREEKKYSDRWLVRWTFALFAATIGLILATGILGYFAWRQSRDMQESIDAAKRSADVAERALTELEAPVVEIKIRDTGLKLGEVDGRLAFSFVNYGRTPARILEFDDAIESVPLGEAPIPPDPTGKRGRAMPYGIFTPPNGGECEEYGKIVLRSNLTGPPAGPYRSESRAMFFVGYVTYSDIFNNVFTVGFCLLYDPQRARWVFRGDEKYNYHRKEDGPYVPPDLRDIITVNVV
jgi:hypothetical protein